MHIRTGSRVLNYGVFLVQQGEERLRELEQMLDEGDAWADRIEVEHSAAVPVYRITTSGGLVYIVTIDDEG